MIAASGLSKSPIPPLGILDPTYTGLNRLSLSTLPDDELTATRSSKTTTTAIHSSITFEGARIPSLRLGGRAAGFTPQAMFRDLHNIGYSRFDDKGSVLMANIDAVLNLTEHVGGYIANATDDNNTSFYSLLLEDHTLEMHSYVQWRRPLSVSRVIMARVMTKPHLKTAQLDTLLKTDIPAIVSLKPCDGYRIVGLIAHGGGDSLTNIQSVTLKDLIVVSLVSLTVMNPTLGKAFVVFPFRSDQKVSGTMSIESIVDFALLCIILYRKVWCFRPYMCSDLICMGFAEPRPDPPKGSIDEQRLLALWGALNLLPPLEKHTSPSTVDPEIAKLAEIDMSQPPPSTKIEEGEIKLRARRDFSRLFDGSDLSILFPKLSQRINTVITTAEDPNLTRDRVEVLARWQLPDTIETSQYPF